MWSRVISRGVEHKTDNLQEDLKSFGVSESDIAEIVSSDDDEVVVDTENEPIVTVFLRLQTQWRKEWMPTICRIAWDGLDYSAVESVIRMTGFDDTAKIFNGIQTMELAALSELNRIDE